VLFVNPLFAQSKKLLKKADKHYKLLEYAEAIPLYEEALSKGNSKRAKSRLANCYRILNRMEQAAPLYAALVNDPPVKAENVYQYGIVLMTLEKYQEAKTFFLQYQELKPEGNLGYRMAEACDQVPYIEPYFEGVTIKSFTQNSVADDTAPIYFNNSIIFASDRLTGKKVLKKKSGSTGRDFLKLYVAKESFDNTYERAKGYSKKFNDLNKNTGSFTANQDGTVAIISRNSDLANKNDTYNIVLYSAESNGDGKWKNIKRIGFCNQTSNYMHPALSPDGQRLFFVSDKAKGNGETDIWMSEWTGTKWGRPTNLGEMINTEDREGFPFFHSDGRLFFCSKGHAGYGGFDIFVTKENENGTWERPMNIGRPINSPQDDITLFLYPEGNRGMFTSSRSGGDDDIYFFSTGNEDAPELEPITFNDPPSEETNLGEEVLEPIEEITENTPTEPTVEQAAPTITEAPQTQEGMEESQELAPVMESADPVVETSEIQTDITALSETEKNIETPSEITAPTLNDVSAEETFATADSNEEEPTPPKVKAPPSEDIDAKTFEADPPVMSDSEPMISPQGEAVIQDSNTVQSETTSVQEVIPSTSTDTNVDTRMDQPESKNPLPVPLKPQMPRGLIFEKQQNAPPARINLEMVTEADSPYHPVEAVQQTIDQFLQKVNIESIDQEDRFWIPEAQYGFNTFNHEVNTQTGLQLDRLVPVIQQHPQWTIQIEVHSESYGEDQVNQFLTRYRAQAAKDYLMDKGIAGDRITATGFGETRLINKCGNDVLCTQEQHMANHRMEIRVIP